MSDLALYVPEPASVKLIECSPPSWAIELALEEKGLPFERHVLSFDKGEHRTSEMLVRNPRGTVPVLTDGEVVLFETIAILQYIERTYPEPALMPRAGTEAATGLNRLHEAGNLKNAGMQLFAYLMQNDPEERDPIRIDAMMSSLHRELEHWERYYGAGTWAAGEMVSLSDMLLFVYVATAVHLGFKLQARYPKIAAAYSRLRERPSVITSWPKSWKTRNYTVLSG